MEKETTNLNCAIYGHNFLFDLIKELNVNTNDKTYFTFHFTFDDKKFKMNFAHLLMSKRGREIMSIPYENITKSDIIFVVFNLYKEKDFGILSSQDFGYFLERYYKNSFKVFIQYKEEVESYNPYEFSFYKVDPDDVIKFAGENKGISEVMIDGTFKCFKCLMRIIKIYLMEKYKKNDDEIKYEDTIDEEIKCHFYSVEKDKKKCEKCCNNTFCLIY